VDVELMSAEDVRSALANTPLGRSTVVEPLGGGWFSWTFEVDGAWIVRFPRDDDVARRHAKEQSLLAGLVDHVAFAVPNPTVSGEWAGRPFFAYRRLPGTAMSCEDVKPQEFSQLLRGLHDFPVEEARRLVGEPGTAETWISRYAQLVSTADARVRPLVPADVAAAIESAFRRFQAAMDSMLPTLVHGDLGLEHVLVSPAGIAVIDFEYATVGDPAIDFIGLWINCGRDTTMEVADRWGRTDEDFWTRLRFYSAMGALHAVIYALDHDDAELRDDATNRLIDRLSELA
jgi:aminoglycoside 2''-phosphotransferase